MKATAVSILTVCSMFTASAMARYDNTVSYDYGYVVSAEPVYQSRQISRPQTSCYTTHRTVSSHNSGTSTVVGAIIGGAIGHAIGHNKSNKRVGMVAGAALGGAIGHDVGRESSRTVTDRDCYTTHHQVEHVTHIDGYDVSYSYNGRIYKTFTPNHPGKRIKIRVSVEPTW